MGATAHSVQIQMQLKSIQGETNQIENIHRYTPTPWLTLLLVLEKSRVKQNSC